MKYLVPILILVVFVSIYVISYLLNSKTTAPKCEEKIDCKNCGINCNKRG